LVSFQYAGFRGRGASIETNEIETIEYNGVKFAQIIWADTRVSETTFFSPPESSFQFGLLAHEAGFIEAPHYHREIKREINDLQQMFVVQRGVVAVQLYSDDKKLLKEVVLKAGDGIVLIHGIHAIEVLEDMQCISVSRGLFLEPRKTKYLFNGTSLR
jgi:hypothetical protein